MIMTMTAPKKNSLPLMGDDDKHDTEDIEDWWQTDAEDADKHE